jgi:hypothetical protein
VPILTPRTASSGSRGANSDATADGESDRVRVSRVADQLIAQGHADNRPDAVRFAMVLIVAAERSRPAELVRVS